jgi:hypothetical protein
VPGHLRPLSGSTVTLPDGSQPGDVVFSPDGSNLVGTPSRPLWSTASPSAPTDCLPLWPAPRFAAQGLGPFGSEFRATNAAQLYVSNAHNGEKAGTVSAFSDAVDGTLTPIGASPFPDFQSAPCWIELSHDGQYLFAVNTPSKSISSYSIQTDGSLMLLGSTSVNAAATPQDARLAPDGSTLWVVDPAGDTVSGFAVGCGAYPPRRGNDS